MKNWFESSYSRSALAEILEDHPQWSDAEVPGDWGRARLARELEILDSQVDMAA
jgi:hypothetical protein